MRQNLEEKSKRASTTFKSTIQLYFPLYFPHELPMSFWIQLNKVTADYKSD